MCTVIAKVRNSIGVVNMFGGVIPPNKFTTPVDFLTFAITAHNYVVALCVDFHIPSMFCSRVMLSLDVSLYFRLSNGGA